MPDRTAPRAPLRVLITDDHPTVRQGLADLLATARDLEVVGVACCGDEGVRLARELEPDVVLMDLSMPGMDGQAATERIMSARPATRVVILTAFADQARVRGALRCGAVTSVLKDAPPAELLGAVRGATAGVR
jgi:DNA-binding NarL/FixJ family response regulator